MRSFSQSEAPTATPSAALFLSFDLIRRVEEHVRESIASTHVAAHGRTDSVVERHPVSGDELSCHDALLS